MRLKRFSLGLRELMVLINNGDMPGPVVTVKYLDIPPGCKVHHLGMNTNGMVIDAYLEHESFPEIPGDVVCPEPECLHVLTLMYELIGESTLLSRNLSEAELVALREEIDNRLCPLPIVDLSRQIKDSKEWMDEALQERKLARMGGARNQIILPSRLHHED